MLQPAPLPSRLFQALLRSQPLRAPPLVALRRAQLVRAPRQTQFVPALVRPRAIRSQTPRFVSIPVRPYLYFLPLKQLGLRDQASAASLAHSSATRPAGRNFTVTALRPIRSAISAALALSYSPRWRAPGLRAARDAERIRRMRR